MVRLKVAEIQKRLKSLNGWTYVKKAISKEYERNDFHSAMDFVNEIVLHAERLDHYPELHIHSRNMVRVILRTATEKGVTDRDFVLAKLIDSSPQEEEEETAGGEEPL